MTITLTKRQREVFRMIRDGAQTKEIAWSLNVSTQTISGHIRRVKKKTGARTIAQALAILMEEDLL